MKRAILGAKAILLLLWTALAFGAYAAVNLVGDLIIRNADILPVPPEGLELISWLLLAAQKISFGAVVVVWLVGAVAIVAIGLLARRAAARRETSDDRRRLSRPRPW